MATPMHSIMRTIAAIVQCRTREKGKTLATEQKAWKIGAVQPRKPHQIDVGIEGGLGYFDLLGGSFGEVAGRCYIRAVGERLAEEVVGVAGARHDLHARVVEQSRDAFAQEDVVLADHDPQRLAHDPTVLL